MNEPERVLVVLWQHPQTRQFVPVGRLVVQSRADGPMFEFAYLRGCESATKLGFQPFAAFPQTDKKYRASSLFPFFKNRILSRSRPDYDRHLEALGLVPTSDAVDMLGRSEGRRQTDQIEVVPSPQRNPQTDLYEVHFWARGVRHVPGADKAIVSLAPGNHLLCIEEPENATNAKALLVCTQTRLCVGYVPDYLVTDVHKLLDKGASEVVIRVEKVNLAPVPPQRRLLCRLTAPWPAGFTPLDTDEFRPLVEDEARAVEAA